MTITVVVNNTTSDKEAVVKQHHAEGEPRESRVKPLTSDSFVIHDSKTLTISEVDAVQEDAGAEAGAAGESDTKTA